MQNFVLSIVVVLVQNFVLWIELFLVPNFVLWIVLFLVQNLCPRLARLVHVLCVCDCGPLLTNIN